jgi:ABC-type transporter Mla subunit MlaD
VRGARRRLVRQVNELGDAAEELRRLLQDYKRVTNRFARRVKGGEGVVDAVEALGATDMRPTVTNALDDFEAARHRTRLAMFELAREEGTSISEMARALRISRQLGSRLAKELDRPPR